MENKDKKFWIIIYTILVIGCVFFIYQSFHYRVLYEEAIKQGAENTVTALEMNVACQSLSNLTIDEIKSEWIDIFLKTKLDTPSK